MTGYYPPFWLEQMTDKNNQALAFGNLYTYVSETLVPLTIYYDINQTTACPNPLPLDDSGFSPEYFMGPGLYTFILKDKLGNVVAQRDNVAGTVGSNCNPYGTPGTSGGYLYYNPQTSAYNWQNISATNTSYPTPTSSGYLYYNSITSAYSWQTVSASNPYTVKVTSSDNSPGYLAQKTSASPGIVLVSGSSLGIGLDTGYLSGKYLPLSGGTLSGGLGVVGTSNFTGNLNANDINTNQINVNNAYIVSEQVTNSTINTLQVANILIEADEGTIGNSVLYVDTTGRVDSVPGNPFQVLTCASDTIPGYLTNKIAPGTGITINYTTDGINGQVMHINTKAANPTGVNCLGKVLYNNGFTVSSTPINIITRNGSIYGTFTINPNTLFYGELLRLNIKFTAQDHPIFLDVYLSGTYGGYVQNIPISAGSSEIDFDVLVNTPPSYGFNMQYQYTIKQYNSPYFQISAPGGLGIFDPTSPMTFYAFAHAPINTASFQASTMLWSM